MFWASARMAVVIPISWPLTFSRGPPLLPGLIGRVGLDQAAQPEALGNLDVASDGTDDAAGDGIRVAVGVADGDDRFADHQIVAAAEFDKRQLAAGVDLQHGQILARIGADDPGLELPAVAEDRLDALDALDDVGIGHDDSHPHGRRSRTRGRRPAAGPAAPTNRTPAANRTGARRGARPSARRRCSTTALVRPPVDGDDRRLARRTGAAPGSPGSCGRRGRIRTNVLRGILERLHSHSTGSRVKRAGLNACAFAIGRPAVLGLWVVAAAASGVVPCRGLLESRIFLGASVGRDACRLPCPS